MPVTRQAPRVAASRSRAVAKAEGVTNADARSYMRKQNKWLKDNRIVAGTTVRVLRSATPREAGWPNSWADTMNQFIGHVLEVEVLTPGSVLDGIPLRFNEQTGYSFPYYVLELLPDAEKPAC